MLHTRIAPAGAALPRLPGGAIVDATNPPARLSQFMRLVREFDRKEVGIAVDHLIELLDMADGDLDLEEPGLEDSFVQFEADGPGCPIADSGTDVAWIEWGTRGRHKDDQGHEPLARHAFRQAVQEDDEDDDPAEQDDDPEDGGDREDIDEREAGSVPEWQPGATCPHAYPDDDHEDARGPAYMVDQTRPVVLIAANDGWSA